MTKNMARSLVHALAIGVSSLLISVPSFPQTNAPGVVSTKANRIRVSGLDVTIDPVPAGGKCPMGATPAMPPSIGPDIKNTFMSTAKLDAAEADKTAKIAEFYLSTFLADTSDLQSGAPFNQKHRKQLDDLRKDLDQGAIDADLIRGWSTVAADCSTAANTSGASDWTVQQAATQAQTARQNVEKAYDNLLRDEKKGKLQCQISGIDSNGQAEYGYRAFLPLEGAGCRTAAITYYYQSGTKQVNFAGVAQYLYNTQQSTSQINADLMTATFSPGLQFVLAGTATVGSAQPNSTTSTNPQSGTNATQSGGTDSLATTVSKLQQGGDFNLRLQYPLLYAGNSVVTQVATFIPNIGFMVNGLSTQNTITSTTNYSLNFPIEAYGEFHSLDLKGEVPAVIYWDARYGGQWISDKLAQATNVGRVFGLGYLAFGVEFSKSVRIGGQYFLGPRAAYCVASTSGCTEPGVSDFKGLHFIVSFSTPKL